MGVAGWVGQEHCKASVQGKKANSWESRSLCQLLQVAGRAGGEYVQCQTEMDKKWLHWEMDSKLSHRFLVEEDFHWKDDQIQRS